MRLGTGYRQGRWSQGSGHRPGATAQNGPARMACQRVKERRRQYHSRLELTHAPAVSNLMQTLMLMQTQGQFRTRLRKKAVGTGGTDSQPRGRMPTKNQPPGRNFQHLQWRGGSSAHQPRLLSGLKGSDEAGTRAGAGEPTRCRGLETGQWECGVVSGCWTPPTRANPHRCEGGRGFETRKQKK